MNDCFGDEARSMKALRDRACWNSNFGPVRLLAGPAEELTVTSFRSELVAEILWELKKINKLATFSEIAGRAGFKAGTDGKTLATCIDAIKRDWPHLQWWRAIPDHCDFKRDSDHVRTLEENGVEFAPSRGRKTWVTFASPQEVLYTWEDIGVEAAT